VFPILGYVVNLAITLVVAAGVFAFWVASRKRIAADTIGRAEEQAARLAKEAERDAEALKKEALLSAKEKAHELIVASEQHARQERQQAVALEQTLTKREALLNDRQAMIDRVEKEVASRDRAVAGRETSVAAATKKYEDLVARQQHELERVASLTADEAKELLIKQIEDQARHESANLLKRLDAEARETAVDRAKHYITQAIQRCAGEHAVETTVSVVDLPSDDLKGRIIGREGRNIRALEMATGVDLIVDDTPGAIILSGFDPYRREIAKQAIERLIADGRIHPARIEEVVQKVKDETDESMRKEGEAVAFDLGLHDLHPDICRLMGRLRYRTSYGQNVLAHSAEVARLAGIMAREVGLDAHVASARRSSTISARRSIARWRARTLQDRHRLPRKHGESEAVVMAMAAHHMDIDWPSLEAMIVQAADDLGGPPRRAPRYHPSPKSSVSRSSKASPTPSRVSPSRSRCRLAAKSGSWSRARRSRTKRPSGSRRTSRAGSKTSSSTRGRSKSPSSEKRARRTTLSDSSHEPRARGRCRGFHRARADRAHPESPAAARRLDADWHRRRCGRRRS
jgi:ribonuclease Y